MNSRNCGEAGDPTVMKKSGGYSRSARKRRNRAGLLSRRMHNGDSDAAFRLLQRRRALAGLKKNGWSFKVHAMNCARRRNHQQQLHAAAAAAERQRLERLSLNLSAKARQAFRARFGAGGILAEYGPEQCRPVVPGGACDKCGWSWASREPHVIAVP
jgi:hypothetical protein